MSHRRTTRWALLGATALAAAGCASWRPEVREARRAEAEAERPPAPPPVPTASVASPSNAEALAVPAAPARTFAELSGRRGGAPAEIVEAVDDLLFASGSASLDPRGRRLLAELAARLAARGGAYRLEIQGHTDGAGGAASNLRIGLARAEAVRRHLELAHGVAGDRMTIVSLGATHPVADESTAAGRARNRRVVVLVIR